MVCTKRRGGRNGWRMTDTCCRPPARRCSCVAGRRHHAEKIVRKQTELFGPFLERICERPPPPARRTSRARGSGGGLTLTPRLADRSLRRPVLIGVERPVSARGSAGAAAGRPIIVGDCFHVVDPQQRPTRPRGPSSMPLHDVDGGGLGSRTRSGDGVPGGGLAYRKRRAIANGHDRGDRGVAIEYRNRFAASRREGMH